MYPYLIAIFVVVMDQLVKLLVLAKVMPYGNVTVIKNFFTITYVENRGMAFGMFQNRMIFLIISTILISTVVSYFIYRLSKKNVFVTICLSCILGGAIGNLIDRIRQGFVVDYLSFSIFPPVFNLADSAVVVGAFVLAAILLFDKELNW